MKGLTTSVATAVPLAVDGSENAEQIRLRARATEAAVKFEAFFIKQMMKQMRASTAALASDDSPLKNRINEDMLGLADGVVADAMAGQRAFGIADLMLRQVLPTLARAGDLSDAAARSPSTAEGASSTRVEP